MSTDANDNDLTIKETSSGQWWGLSMTHLACIPQLLLAGICGFSLLRSNRGLSLIDRILILLVLINLGSGYGYAIYTNRRARLMRSPSDQNQRLLSLCDSLLLSLTVCVGTCLMLLFFGRQGG
jgi:hypothetical protein